MIDLHAHTTASDGRSTPQELVERAASKGIRTLGVTDHDTMAAHAEATAAAQAVGVTIVPGIEVTTVFKGKDTHVLGYFVDPATPGLEEMMAGQRARRVERARAIAAGLARMGAPIDLDELLASAGSRTGKAIARPQIAHALIKAGHVETVAEAFDKFLGEHCEAYVPHTGASPMEAVALIVRGGGIASLAHAGTLKKDEVIEPMVEAGMAAIEAYHSSHDAETVAHYLAIARRLDLAVTGGSDYHGEGVRRAEFFGVVGLPADEFDRFLTRAGRAPVA